MNDDIQNLEDNECFRENINRHKYADYQNSKLKCYLDVISLFFLGLGAIAGLSAVVMYGRQNYISENTNSITVEGQLLNIEREACKVIESKPYLQAIYIKYSKELDQSLAAHNAVDIFYEQKGNRKHFVWKTIPDLYERLFSAESFNDQDNERLREAYLLAEDFLYLLENAYFSKEVGLIDDDDWGTWVGYIDDIGMNPMFLSAIYCGHKYAYIDESFAKEIRKRLIMKDSKLNVLKTLYPDLLSEEWPNKVGESRLD